MWRFAGVRVRTPLYSLSSSERCGRAACAGWLGNGRGDEEEQGVYTAGRRGWLVGHVRASSPYPSASSGSPRRAGRAACAWRSTSH